MDIESSSFRLQLAAELRGLERRLVAAHEATVAALAPPLGSPGATKQATSARAALLLHPAKQESEGSGRGDSSPVVPRSAIMPLQDLAMAGLMTEAVSMLEGSTLGEPAAAVSMRWWNLAVKILSTRDQPGPRAYWEEFETTRAALRGSLALPTTSERDLDIVQRSWTQMTQDRGSRSKITSLTTHQPHWCHRTRFVIHPYSWKRMAWILLGFAFMGFDIFCLTMDQFLLLSTHTRESVELAAALYWSLDIGLSFMTGIFKNSKLDLRLPIIARNYVTTWFVFDLCMVTLQWTTQPITDGDISAGPAGIVRYIRTARYLRLLRFLKFDQLLTSILERVNSVSTLLLVRICQHLAAVCLWLHTSACAWYALGVSNENGWAMARESIRNWPVNYLVAVHWAASNLQGNVDINPGDLASERGFTVGHIFISMLVLCLFLSKLTNVMATMEEITAKLNRQSNAAQQYCKHNRISTQLSMRVRKWLEWHQVLDAKRQRGVEEDEFMQILPKDLRRALLDESRSPLLMEHEVFHACRECNIRFFQRLCCDTFSPLTHLPEEEIFSYGMVCTRMYLVASGEGSYLKYGTVMRALMQNGSIMHGLTASTDLKDRYKRARSELLCAGGALCEAVLWVHWVHLGDFSALTRLSLLVLDARTFEDLVTLYPNVQLALQTHAQRFSCAISTAKDPSDLFNTSSVLHAE